MMTIINIFLLLLTLTESFHLDNMNVFNKNCFKIFDSNNNNIKTVLSGIDYLQDYLNSPKAFEFLQALTFSDKKISEESRLISLTYN